MRSTVDLQVHWESRWRSFCTALRPALMRSPRPLALEQQRSPTITRAFFSSLLLHAGVIGFSLSVVPLLDIVIRPPVSVRQLQSQYEIHMISAPYLPQLTDAGGAEQGIEGRAGGHEAYHPRQVIRISRGRKLTDTVVDAPRLNLPPTTRPVANMVVVPAKPVLAAPEISGLSQKLRTQLQSVAVVPPPPDISASRGRNLPGAPAPAVVPPPVNPTDLHASRALQMPAQTPVAPAPRVDFGIGSSRRLADAHMVVPVGTVIPPPVNAAGLASDARRNPMQAAGGNAATPVPPAPKVDSGIAPSRSLANAHMGIPVGTVIPPPVNAAGLANGARRNPMQAAGGNGAGSVTLAQPAAASGNGDPVGGNSQGGFIISSRPGQEVGAVEGNHPGTLAMSPAGSGTTGAGGSGTGSGIAHGSGPGSGIKGSGTGAAKSGSGPGADPNVAGGNSTAKGPGGTGTGDSITVGFSGVSISGGAVTLPSFGAGAADPKAPPRGPGDSTNRPSITVVATGRSGGGTGLYGYLKGEQVYTIYVETRAGIVVLQFAEHGPTTSSDVQLAPPEAVNVDLPTETVSHLLVGCMLDRAGKLQNLRILEAADAKWAATIITALAHWRFRPALRNDRPVAVDAILEFQKSR